MIGLTDTEHAVLETLANHEHRDPLPGVRAIHFQIVKAAEGDVELAHRVLKDLRRRKLVDATGDGRDAFYRTTLTGARALLEREGAVR